MGYWKPPALRALAICCAVFSVGAGTLRSDELDFRRGDSNVDDRIDLSDAVATLRYLLRGRSAPPCFDAADTNDDGRIDISDPIYGLAFLFRIGPPPPPPGTSCGPDPTADSLSCDFYPFCDTDQPPQISLEAPTEGEAGDVVSLRVGVVDDDPVALVEIFVDGELHSAFSAPPYLASLRLPLDGAGGSVTVLVRATDSTGLSSEVSQAILIRAPPDTTAPNVALTVPSEAVAGAELSIAATATDDVGIASVEFFLDGQSLGVTTQAPYESTFTVPLDRAGETVQLLVRATDAAGNVSEDTASLVVRMPPDTTAPAVTLTVPTEAVAGDGVLFSAEASDDRGVARVEFLVDGVVLSTDSEAPFEANYAAPASLAGSSVEVLVRVFDEAGNSSEDTASLPIRAPVVVDASPQVTLSGPAEALAGSILALSAQAVDDISIDVLRLLLAGAEIDSRDAPPYDFSFTVPAGTPVGTEFVFTALAVDGSLQEARDLHVVRVVGEPDVSPPRVLGIEAPSEVTPSATFTALVQADDAVGIALVEVVDVATGDVIASDDTEPFSLELVAPGTAGAVEYRVRVTDFAGNSAEESFSVDVVEDYVPTAPEVVVVVPETARPGAEIRLGAQVVDAAGIEVVEFYRGTTRIAELATSPYTVTYRVPVDAQPGDIIGFEVRVRNVHGLEATAAGAVRIVDALPTLVTGEVYGGANGHPLDGASVELLDAGTTVLTDADGRYAFTTSAAEVTLAITSAGHLPAFRKVRVSGGAAATDVHSVHLRLQSPGSSVSAVLGGEVAADGATAALQIDAGSLTADVDLAVVRLGPHELPGFLPMGWSPAAAHAITPLDTALGVSATLLLSGLQDIGTGEPAVATWVPPGSAAPDGGVSTGAWYRVAGTVQREGESVSVRVAKGGVYVIALPDASGNPALPSAGGRLGEAVEEPPGELAHQILPSDPIIFSSPEEINDVGLLLSGLEGAPSGFSVRVDVTESYEFIDGTGLILRTYPHDLAIYRRGDAVQQGEADGKSAFRIAPTRAYGPQTLREGQIDLAFVQAGGVEVETVLGSDGGLISAGDASLQVTAGELVDPVSLELLSGDDVAAVELPATLTSLGSLSLRVTGSVESFGAQLEIPAPDTADGPVLVIEQRVVDGRTRLVVVGEGAVADGVAAADVNASDGSVWVLASVDPNAGQVHGVVRRGAVAAAGALVSADDAPPEVGLVFVTAVDGAYRLPVAAGDRTLRAIVSATGEVASVVIAVEPALEIEVDLLLGAALPLVLSVTPPDGVQNVSGGASVVLEFSMPIDEATLGPVSVRLSTGGVPVSAEYAVLPGATSVVLTPSAVLTPSTVYDIEVTAGLETQSGEPFVAFQSSFATLDNRPPRAPGIGEITMSTPDERGIITLSAGPGTIDPSTAITAVNETTTATGTVVAANDGSFTVRVPASVQHEIRLVFRDASGNETSVSPGIFDAGDGSGYVAEAGGVLTAPDGAKLEFAPGTFASSSEVIYEPMEETESPIDTTLLADEYGLEFGAGFRLFGDGQEIGTRIELELPVEPMGPDGAKLLLARVEEIEGELALIALTEAVYDASRGVATTQTEDSGRWPGLTGTLYRRPETESVEFPLAPAEDGLGRVVLAGVGFSFLDPSSFLLIFLPEETFVTGGIFKAPPVGILKLEYDREVRDDSALRVTARAVLASPSGDLEPVTVQSIQFQRLQPDGTIAPEAPTFEAPANPGPNDVLLPVSPSAFVTVRSSVGNTVIEARAHGWNVDAVFVRNGREYRLTRSFYAEVITPETPLSSVRKSIDLRPLSIAPEPRRAEYDPCEKLLDYPPVSGGLVELYNGLGRAYPTLVRTNNCGSFTLAARPGPAQLRIFDPLTGHTESFRLLVPHTPFDYVDVNEIFVPSTPADVLAPTVSIQLAGPLRVGSSFEIDVTATDDLAVTTLEVNVGHELVCLAGGGAVVSCPTPYTPLIASTHTIRAIARDAIGNETTRVVQVDIRPEIEGDYTFSGSPLAISSSVSIGGEGGDEAVDFPLDGCVYVELEWPASTEVPPQGTLLEQINGLDIRLEDPGSDPPRSIAIDGEVIGGTVCSGAICRVFILLTPVDILPPETTLQLAVNAQPIATFRTLALDPPALLGGFQEIRDLAIRDALIYVADFGAQEGAENQSIRVIEFSDPVAPEDTFQSMHFPGGARALALMRDGPISGVTVTGQEVTTSELLVVVGGGQSSTFPLLRVYDASAINLKLLATAVLFPFSNAAIPNEVAVRDGLAYVCAIGAGIQVVDVARLVDLERTPFADRVDGERNGQAAIQGGFRLPNFEIEPPYAGAPFDVGLELSGLTIVGGGGPRVFVLSNSSGYIDLIPSPTLQEPFELAADIQRLELVEDFIVQAQDAEGVTQIRNIQLAAISHGSGGGADNLSLVDLSNPADPVLLSSVLVAAEDGSPLTLFDIEIDDGFLYTGERVISILDPKSPISQGPIAGLTTGGSVALSRVPGTPREPETLYGISSTGDRKGLQIVRLPLPPRPDRDWDIIRTTEYEPVLHPDAKDLLHLGDPVIPYTGELMQVETDLSIRGRGFDFAFTRTYRSRRQYSGPIGYGWSHNYDCRLTVADDGVTFYDGGVRGHFFAWTGSEFTAPTGVFKKLTHEGPAAGDVVYFLEDEHGMVKRFERVDYALDRFRMTQIADRVGNVVRLKYDTLGRLSTIRDTMGRDIRLTYDDRGRITTLVDFKNRTVSYAYDRDDNLVSVTSPSNDDPAGRVIRYTYSAGFPKYKFVDGSRSELAHLNHNLLTVTDAEGQVYLENVYYDTLDSSDVNFDRVRTQRLGCEDAGGEYSFEYFTDGSTATPPRVTHAVTRTRRNNYSERHYNDDGHLELLRVLDMPTSGLTDSAGVVALSPSSSEPRVTQNVYDQEGRLLSTTSPRGKTTSYTYRTINDRRRLQDLKTVTVTPALSGASAGYVGAFTDSGDRQPRTHEYDYTGGAYGVPTKVTDPLGIDTVQVVDARGQIESITRIDQTEYFSYGAYGELRSHTSAAGVVTRHDYYEPDDPNGDNSNLETAGARADGELDPGPGYLRSITRDASGGVMGMRRVDRPAYDLTTTYEYDVVGNRTASIDPRGLRLDFAVNDLNQTTEIVDPVRGTWNFTFDLNNNLETETRELVGYDTRVLSHTYDCLDQRIRTVDNDLSRTTTLAYDADENLASVTTPEGFRLVTVTDQLGFSVEDHVADAAGLTDANGRREKRYRDLGNNVVGVEDGEGERTYQAYNGFDELTLRVDPNGNRTRLSYDVRGDLIETERQNSAGDRVARTRLVRDDLGRVVETIVDVLDETLAFRGQEVTRTVYRDCCDLVDSLEIGQRSGEGLDEPLQTVRDVSFEYDGLLRVVRSEDVLGNVVEKNFGENGASTLDLTTVLESGSELGPGGDSMPFTLHTLYEYPDSDALRTGRVRRVLRGESPDVRVTNYSYDGRDQVTEQSVDGGESIKNTYDVYGRLERFEIVDGDYVEEYEYDNNDRIVGKATTVGSTRRLSFVYDARDRLRRTTYADGTARQLDYYLDDVLRSLTDRAGNVFDYVYDPGNRLESIDVVSAADGFVQNDERSFGYDALDRVKFTASVLPDATPRTVEYDYDSRGLVRHQVYGAGAVEAVYNLQSERIACSYPSISGLDFETPRDELGRLASVSLNSRELVNYDYSGATHRQRATFGNSTEVLRLFTKSREERSRTFKSSGALQSGFTYRRNASGRIEGVERSHEGASGDAYRYSPEQWIADTRIGTRTPLDPTAVSDAGDGVRQRYAYDGHANWVSVEIDGDATGYSSNDLNQYGTIGAESASYDLNGNLRTLGTRTCSYNAYNELVRVEETEAGVDIHYAYDAEGRKVREQKGDEIEEYVYDGDNIVVVIDEAGEVVREYVFSEITDQPLLLRTGGDEYWYHCDGMGSVIALTNAQGAVVERYRYDPFGRTTIFAPDGSGRAQSAFGNRRLFKGSYYEPMTGLYCMRAREYDPELGRFLQADPAGDVDGLNLYAFAGNDPVQYYDPTGLFRQASAENITLGHTGPIRLTTGAQIASLAALGVGLARLAPAGWRLARSLLAARAAGTAAGTAGTAAAVGVVARVSTVERVRRAWRAAKEGFANWRAGHIPHEIDPLLAGTTTMGETAVNGSITLRPGLSATEKLETLRHEGIHAVLSVSDDAPMAAVRQELGIGAYNNSAVLNALEEGLAETLASGNPWRGLKHAFNRGYEVRGSTVVTPSEVVAETSVFVRSVNAFRGWMSNESVEAE